MLVEARVRFRHRGCYSETLPPGVQVVHLSGDGGRCLCTINGPSTADLDKVVEALSPWLDEPLDVIERGTRSIVLRCNCPSRGLTTRIVNWGANVLWPVVHRDGLEWWHLVAPSREVMSSVLDKLRELGDVHVEKLGNPSADELGVSLPMGELTRELSAKQLDALRLAVTRGYYTSPRCVTLADLAREVGISRSTFQEHLQKAEERIMDRFGGVLAQHPALLAAATRRAGRPRKR